MQPRKGKGTGRGRGRFITSTVKIDGGKEGGEERDVNEGERDDEERVKKGRNKKRRGKG